MDEIVVTRLWMAGVVGMMVVFAIIAVVGYWRKKLDDGSVQEIDVKVGDNVLFGQYSGSTVKIDGEEMLIMSESEIFGVIE